ncbi:MAG TPA: hypothetical protein VGA05_01225 [Candidatus Bathyarchaeia archaeon]
MDLVKSSFQALLPPISILATITSTAAQILPWMLVAVSLYALFSLRPALMITILTVFFLILTSIIGQIDVYLAGLVVASSFTSLVGFSHARAAKILQRRSPILESRGPLIFKITSSSFDLLLPIISALGVMAVIAYVMGTINSEVAILPEPLATLGGLYLASHYYLVLTILTVAGAAVWVLRSILEPIILRFTLTPDDARELAFQEVRDTYAKIVWESSKRPSRGRAPVILFSLLLILAIAVLTLTLGPSQSINELMAALGLARVQPSHAELLTNNLAVYLTRLADALYSVSDAILRFIIRLLWG